MTKETISREELYKKLEEGHTFETPVRVKPTFKTPFVMVYGTLRAGMGNYLGILHEKSEHLQTLKLSGFRYNGGLSAEYTGNEEDSLVVDVFRIHGDKLDSVNANLDALEGVSETHQWYLPLAVPVTVEGETVMAKFYESPSKKTSESNDYAGRYYKQNPETYGKFLQEYAPASYAFYQEIFEKEDTTI